MSKVKIQGNASGTGVLTVTAPNTSTDRTITLPDSTGSLIADNGSGQVGIGTTTHHDATTKLTVSGRINTTNGTATGSMNYGGGAVVNMGALTNHPVNLMVNNSTKWVIDTNGNLIAEGGGGIVLGNTSYAASNELDDYEEGTHTVTVTMGTGTVALHTNNSTFQYTKIGRVVHVSGQVLIDSASNPDGEFQMSLPFTVGNGSSFYSVGNYRTYNVDTPNDGVQAVVFANSSEAKCNFVWSRDSTTSTNERATVNGYYMIGLTYMT